MYLDVLSKHGGLRVIDLDSLLPQILPQILRLAPLFLEDAVKRRLRRRRLCFWADFALLYQLRKGALRDAEVAAGSIGSELAGLYPAADGPLAHAQPPR